MSLITWYPLIGNLNDYSSECNNITSSGGISVNNNGKIGKCYHFNNGYAITKNTLCGTNIFSICFWMKPNSPGAWTNIFSTNDSSYFRLEVTDNNSIYRMYGDGPIGSNVVVLDGIQNNKWVHVSIVSDGTKWYSYVNGILNKSGNCTSYLIKGDNLYIGRRGSNNNSWNGYLNDIRIYNHALSVKEVKEIAKANILHYKFNDAMEEPTNNLKNTVNFSTAEKGSDYFVKKDSDEWYRGATLPNTTVTAGKTYTWSFDILSDRTFSIQFDANCTASNYTGNDAAMESSKPSTSAYDTPGEWKRVYLTVTVKADATSPYLHHAFCPRIAGVDLKVYVRRPLLEEKDHNTPYTKDTRNIGVSDSSGLRNHANMALVTCPSWQSDSAMGDGSFKFNGAAKMSDGNYQHIKSVKPIRIPEEGTISFYIKHSGTENSDNKYAVGFSNFCSMNNNNIMGLIYYYDASNYTNRTVTKQLRDGNWHLYTITWSNVNNTVKFYADGVLVGSAAPGAMYHIGTERYFLVGNAWGTSYGGHSGGLDDIRLYATQLSDSDVLDLYRTKGSLSKNGRMFMNEINENIRSLVSIENVGVSALSNVTLSSSKDLNKGILKITNSATTSGSFRITFPLDRLTAHVNKPITFSFNYKIIKGTNFTMNDWCDGNITKREGFNTMRAQGSRSAYDSTYRFMDFNISADTEVEIWNIKLESKALLDYKTSVTKKGILDTQEIMELDCSSMKVKNELGATWVRLFYHNNQSGTVFFSSNKQEFLKCRDINKISDLWALELFRGKDGKFEFLLQYQSGGSSYNRWKQSSNFTREPVKGYEAVQVSWTGNLWGGLEYNGGGSTWADGSVNHGNWFYAIGCKSVYSGGMPSWSSAETGWVELWVRCEDPEVMKMLKNGNCRATEFIEI